jgi:hypothetical protein
MVTRGSYGASRNKATIEVDLPREIVGGHRLPRHREQGDRQYELIGVTAGRRIHRAA